MRKNIQRFLIVIGLFVFASPLFAKDFREFEADLKGKNEVPPVVTEAEGEVKLKISKSGNEIGFKLEIEDADPSIGMLAVAGSHIHCGVAGQTGPIAAFLAQPVPGGISGKAKFKGTLTDADVRPTACGTTIAELVQAIAEGRAYVNAHSTAHPTGEIRGQLKAD
ncbi:MAG: CHRD domain-containing protein [Caldilineaceae bacterium]